MVWNVACQFCGNFGSSETFSRYSWLKVCQTFLGSPKSHRAKDPAKHLGPMFMQVIMTFFELMIDLEYFWKDTSESWPSNIFGFGLGATEKPPPVSVDTEALYSSFTSGFDHYGEVWKKLWSCEPGLRNHAERGWQIKIWQVWLRMNIRNHWKTLYSLIPCLALPPPRRRLDQVSLSWRYL